ncbi:hypothetical protein C8N43_1998 [Litoreibacter ponti]|uniref:Uncharacterized protein n=1 Tax=Litoreibacter ponti TaxID=1510457 RepID=A0A2T6BMP1_9RHOB|nr:hypothetical protein [Litoreibacter ponti]PTX57331.1 hypothetical protein C8N43_1998 [Litoreibacter ponti]
MTLRPTSDPTPGRYYQAKGSDTWLKLIGRAYGARSGSKRRLALSKMANNHPDNWRLQRDPKNDFEEAHYPHGLVSLSRRFSCTEADFETPSAEKVKSGSCRAIVYIPPEDDIWFDRPPEVVQRKGAMCWAAALSSLSRTRRLARRFRSQNRLVRVARKKLKTKKTGREISIVTGEAHDNGLRVIPNIADADTGTRRGEETVALLAEFMGLNYTAFFGDGGPGDLQQDSDDEITLEAIHERLSIAGGPIIIFRSNRGSPGHVSVVFGASLVDNVYMEMDPFRAPFRSGPVFGRRRTRVIRNRADLGSDPFLTPSEEIYVLF